MRIKKQYVLSFAMLFIGTQTLMPKELESENVTTNQKRNECQPCYKKTVMKITMGLLTAVFVYYRLSQKQQQRKMGSLLVLFD